MSTPAYVDSKTITLADGAQSSRVPVPLPDDPYVAVRQAQLVDTESKPEEAPSEAEGLQSLGSRVPLLGEEFEAFEPSGTRTDSSHSSASLDSTAPLSPDHPLTHVLPTPTPTRASFHRRTARMTVRVQPAMSPGHSARVAEAMALSDSAFRKRYRSSYETPSPSSTLPVRKRYRGRMRVRMQMMRERERSEDEGPGLERSEEEAVPEGQQQAAPAADTAVGEPLGLGYGALRRRELAVEEDQVLSTFEIGQSSGSMPEQQGAERVSAFRQPTLTSWVDSEDGRVYTDIPVYVPPVAPIQTPSSPEWSSGSLPILPSSLVVPSLIASLVATPTATMSVDEDQFIEMGAQDVRELYTRSGAVRDEIFLQRYMFRSLEREQERVAVTFGALWRPVLALEAWAGQTDAQRAAMWHAIYDIQRENHDLRMQLAEERRERLELADHVARMERRHESREE
ncbi:hypothetical protein Tco_0581560 [Tanacetum coccineum]